MKVTSALGPGSGRAVRPGPTRTSLKDKLPPDVWDLPNGRSVTTTGHLRSGRFRKLVGRLVATPSAHRRWDSWPDGTNRNEAHPRHRRGRHEHQGEHRTPGTAENPVRPDDDGSTHGCSRAQGRRRVDVRRRLDWLPGTGQAWQAGARAAQPWWRLDALRL